MIRRALLWLHRWVGLAMTAFLVIVALTGSAIAFHEQIDAWLNPEFIVVARRDQPLLDPFTLRDRAAAQVPGWSINIASLQIEPDRSVRYFLEPPASPSGMSGHDEDHGFADLREAFFDPYTGEKLGERYFLSGPTLERRKLLGFFFRLHYSLSAPWGWNFAGNNVGGFLLGVTALLWTVDCFVAAYLTFPIRTRSAAESTARKSWWRRWKPAWLVRMDAGFYRFNFDVHRAFGLWTWAMLFVFAWSGVHFNLDQVYAPVMKGLVGAPTVATADPQRDRIDQPALGWREAYARSSRLMQEEAAQRGTRVLQDIDLFLVRDSGEYDLVSRCEGDVNRRGANVLRIDANTGSLIGVWFEREMSTADTVTNWLVNLHDAGAFGLPMKIFVCAMGFVITILSLSGVYVWWKKRRGRRHQRLWLAPARSSE